LDVGGTVGLVSGKVRSDEDWREQLTDEAWAELPWGSWSLHNTQGESVQRSSSDPPALGPMLTAVTHAGGRHAAAYSQPARPGRHHDATSSTKLLGADQIGRLAATSRLPAVAPAA
jgi:hypothetical protein